MTRSRSKSGFSFVETLVATLILMVGIVGLMTAVASVFQMTRSVDRTGMATEILRKSIETTRSLGFNNATEGATTAYYDVNGVLLFTRNGAAYEVVTTVTSDEFQISQGGATVPGDYALRRVVVAVSKYGENTPITTSGTYLVRGGL